MGALAAIASVPGNGTVEESRPIRVMIVDDSIVARAVLARILASANDMELVAQAGSGRAALAKLADVTVDLILLDLEMPGMNGLEALPELLATSDARVLVVSSLAEKGAIGTMTALKLGAADTLLKPQVGVIGGAFAGTLLSTIRRIARAEPAVPPTALPRLPRSIRAAAEKPISCVAIGASTGGVHALSEFFASYPRDCAAPILITQHLPGPFMTYFAGQLEEMARRRTRVAEDGMAVQPETILLAPGEASITLQRTRGTVHVRLLHERGPSGCLPSVDPMFESVAREYGAQAAGVVLSGMGRDGLIGATALVKAGAEVIVQDSATSVVWGMPGVVAQAGLAAHVLSPAMLADRIARRQAVAGVS